MDRTLLARRIIDYGLTEQDLTLGHGDTLTGVDEGALLQAAPGPAGLQAAPGPVGLQATQNELGELFPDGLAPTPALIDPAPASSDALPRADYVVITWTVAELQALADVFTPGISRTSWHAYDRKFKTDYLPKIRAGAPARAANRLASYCPTAIGDKSVLAMKSELHLNQDGIKTGEGTATLPVADLFRQIIDEAQPKLIITTGTAGAVFADHDLGDVMVTRAAKFRCQSEFRNEPFANQTYRSDFEIPQDHFDDAKKLLAAHADKLTEPDFAPPTTKYKLPGQQQVLPGRKNNPSLKLDGKDFAEFKPILTTDFFEFGTSTNHLADQGCGVEMGDAALGMVCEELGDQAPRWLVVRNASDPQINGNLPTSPDVQAMWAVWFYEQYGYWTSISSAIACWAIIAGDHA
jgi:nucleoside phosphorylase